jgi:hypothetical protein
VRLAESFARPGNAWGAAAYGFDEVRLDPAIRQAVLIVTGAVVLLLLMPA